MPLTLATIEPGKPEIFAAPQGEGPSAGLPSVFVRLSRCNLACQWCDTAYTWRFEGDNRPHRDEILFERKANQLTLDELDVAALIAAHGRNRLVITGGEPLLQGAALARMLAGLPDLHVEVETNGTVAPHPALDPFVNQYNVSPKLSHSGNPAEVALIPERLAAFAADPRAWFKFVVGDPAHLAEVLVLQRRHAIPASRIYLMPEGRDSRTLRERRGWIEHLCSAHGYMFTDRLHIHLHGDTRGT
jgi:7-carboxy-7-deazaguanine synthase